MLLEPFLIPLEPDTMLNSLPTPALMALAEPEVVTESSVRKSACCPAPPAEADSLRLRFPNLKAFLYLALLILIT